MGGLNSPSPRMVDAMPNEKTQDSLSDFRQKVRRNRTRARLYTASRLLFILFTAIFVISLVTLCVKLYREKREARAFDDLSALIDTETAEAPVESGMTEPTEGIQAEADGGILKKYQKLHSMNTDMFGWIGIEGTQINYPVMHTPEDEEYYLRRAFDGTYARSGVPFMDKDCTLDCGNYIIYGHNMYNGAMFTELISYADQTFWEEHPTIRFDTIYAEGEYQVVAAFYSRVFYTYETDVFRYYNYSDLTDPEVFEEYVTNVQALARYDTGVVPEHGDELITLITCSYGSEHERFVVVACKKS